MASQCIVIGHIRGSMLLLYQLLVDVAKVVFYENGEWKWIVSDTTVVILGDFIDPYDDNHLQITRSEEKEEEENQKKEEQGKEEQGPNLGEAIQSQLAILKVLETLQKSAKEQGGNQLVILLGDHEAAQLVQEVTYRRYATPNEEDYTIYDRHFRSKILVDFMCHRLVISLMVGWGPFLMTHSGMTLKFLKRMRCRSIHRLNQTVQQWLADHKWNKIRKYLLDPDSPLLTKAFFESPQRYQNQEETQILHYLNLENESMYGYYRWVVGGEPISALPDTRLIEISQDKETLRGQLAVFKSYSLNPLVYFIHNKMGRVFGNMFLDPARESQVLRIQLYTNPHGEPLFFDTELRTAEWSGVKIVDKIEEPN